ncbi:hypothetical protein GCM10025868_10260 [Angustibacter aerolatus]|uniref:ComEC/Rec2-related protein domain-containing protein n=1 Tax=Angustibacter aerolatus TaxID=1162965 RepID=A0ABQ6JG75_9ACTN|nr:hypothetical protein GCM10025868_10260 [Angustibacter aerolatus]
MWLRVRSTVRYRLLPSTAFHLLSLTALAVVITFASIYRQDLVPLSAFTLVLVAGGFLLRPRELLLVCVLVAVGVWYAVITRPDTGTPFNKGLVVVLVANAVVMVFVARSRARLGLQGTLGESMLVDLRDRLRAQGERRRCPTTGTPRRCCGRRTARRSPATSWSPAARPTARTSRSRWSTCRARGGGRHPGAAAVGRVRRAARLGAGPRLPAVGQQVAAAPALARGLRDGRARRPRAWPRASSGWPAPGTRRRRTTRPGRAGGCCSTSRADRCSA